jgi:hypothetical protein
MFGWLRWLFGSDKPQLRIYRDPLEDPEVQQAVINACITGKIAYGVRQPDGSWKIEIEDAEEHQRKESRLG